jgi:hypothetical protein
MYTAIPLRIKKGNIIKMFVFLYFITHRFVVTINNLHPVNINITKILTYFCPVICLCLHLGLGSVSVSRQSCPGPSVKTVLILSVMVWATKKYTTTKLYRVILYKKLFLSIILILYM